MLYTAYSDGGVRGGNPGRAAWAFVIKNEVGDTVHKEAACMSGKNTNNAAEYAGIIAALTYLDKEFWFAPQTPVILVRSDSQLVVRQMTGEYLVHNDDLKSLYAKATRLLWGLGAGIEWVRGHADCVGNIEADALVNKVQDEWEAKNMTTKRSGR